MEPQLVKLSKFLSLILRHQPDMLGLTLDPEGWCDVEVLITAARQHGVPLTRAIVEHIVAENNKQRFAFSPGGQQIRASQGHSLTVDLGLEPLTPPEILFHGTATRFVGAIRQAGLLPQGRQYVHLSPDETTALNVGRRHGQPVVLRIFAGQMHVAGHAFYLSANGVWLAAHVPVNYIVFPK
jgi:putative RNA 2'-phosphotransferase